MKIHEYQARTLLQDAEVPVPSAQVVDTVNQAVAAHEQFGHPVVVKAQVFAGGRGKAGFVKVCRTPQETRDAADFMLTHRMVSKQTGPDGIEARKLLVASVVDIESEYYAAVVLDRTRRCPVAMVSREGGVEIEDVAARNPDAIVREWFHPHLGLQEFQIRRLVKALALTEPAQVSAAGKAIRGLARAFLENDCSLAEINPLIRTKQGDILAIDAKINIDDNALFRLPAIRELQDTSEDNPIEVRANQAGLNYIALDGNIGCLVNGAGLAMATMDLIKLHGGEPANFLDVGGSVTKEQAIEAFRILMSDRKVQGILVNIFGGIAKCDTIAEALVAAAHEVGFKVPVVVRLEGTNVEKARTILSETDVEGLISSHDLTEAAQKVCSVVTKE